MVDSVVAASIKDIAANITILVKKPDLTDMERGELAGLASSLESIADNLPPEASKLKTALTHACTMITSGSAGYLIGLAMDNAILLL